MTDAQVQILITLVAILATVPNLFFTIHFLKSD